MTPKEKAEQLADSFLTASFGKMQEYVPVPYEFAKQCALIAVNQIILANPHSNPLNTFDTFSTMHYWKKVKQEIEKL
jgi:hypothetical protein